MRRKAHDQRLLPPRPAVHDAFNLIKQTPAGPIRMIGAGTPSKRIRSTPPRFNELILADGRIDVRVRNLAHVPTPAMQIDDVPPDALPPIDPPVH